MKMYEVLSLRGVYDKIKSNKMSIKTLYKLNKIFEACEKEFEFYQKEFNKILEEYGKKDENGQFVYTDDGAQSIKIKEGLESECQQKFNDLLNLDIEDIGIKLKLEDLDNIKMSFEEMRPLLYFIEE